MKLSEAANLGDALKDNCKNLVNFELHFLYIFLSFKIFIDCQKQKLSLNLRENQIDDDILHFIILGLNNNISLMELNLSHNKIGDQGYFKTMKSSFNFVFIK